MSANLYRIVRGQVHKGGMGSVIEDRGYLRRAMAASNGYYLFSERGAGVQELVLLGTRTDVLVWLGSNYTSGIENLIADLPGIYMGVEPYKPGVRFKGLFPVHDVTKALFDATMGMFGPSNTLTDAVGAISDLKTALEFKPEIGVSEKTKPPKVNGELYIKFSYLPAEKMTFIGKRRIDFQTIRKLLQKVI